MRLALTLIIALIFSLFSCPDACCEEKKAKDPQKAEIVASMEKIANGKTFQDQNSKNVSFTLSPIRAFLKISF